MKYHWTTKLGAFLIATVFLVAAVSSSIGIACLAVTGLYSQSVEEVYDQHIASETHQFAVNLAHRYASMELGGIPKIYLEQYYGDWWLYNAFKPDTWFYTIADSSGKILESNLPEDTTGLKPYKIEVTNINYRQLLTSTPYVEEETIPETTMEPTSGMEEAECNEITESPVDYAGIEETAVTEPARAYTVTSDGIYSDGYWDHENQTLVEVTYRLGNLKYCLVTVYLAEGALQEAQHWEYLRALAPYKYNLFWVLGIGLIGFAACAVYLCFASARTPNSDQIKAGGLNKIPLDLYGAAAFLGEALLINFLAEIRYSIPDIPALAIPYGATLVTAICVLAEGFLLALVAQCKMKHGYWWRNTLVGRFVRFCGRWTLRGLKAARNMLPIVARWVGLILILAMGALVSLIFAANAWHDFWIFFWGMWFLGFCLLILVTIGYGAWCFGSLLNGAKNMAQGDLNQKINNQYLRGAFRQMAAELNSLADGAKIAAERQMKSERMKTELITNVSHDIKTPLTSIINYVDLLKSAETEEERNQYLEVLDRQSQALKKLIEDLMDMSKASSGNVTVELSRIDIAEAVNQALGEFSDKLDAVALTPVFRHPEEAIAINADGKHLWRILHNLLSNACKYAMPGTRLYLDLMTLDGKAVLAIKNISKEELNMDAEALMERFVRGDASRNTEGNGLGLNIAQSLTHLQKGEMELLVDGDLFKVTLIFPLA